MHFTPQVLCVGGAGGFTAYDGSIRDLYIWEQGE